MFSNGSVSPPHGVKQTIPFEEFFELGQEESASPFLTPASRKWGKHLPLKSALSAAVLLTIAFGLSFIQGYGALSNLLLVIVYFIAGVPSLIEAAEELSDFEINIDILMTLAAFSSVLIGSSMEGALLLVLFSISGSLENAVTTKAKSAISSLHKLSPSKAFVLESDGKIIERSIKDITVATHILVKSGQVVPLDGIVIDGSSSVNLVHLTGENEPILKKIGDSVAAGARNMEGALTLSITHTSADSTLARIIQLVTQAQESRPALQRWFDKLSKGYALTIILLSALFAVSLPWIMGIPFLGMEGGIYRALAFLIAASPCALIIALPVAYLSAIGSCARKGILLKGGITLDALASCSVIAFDKTGTLTTGELTLEAIVGLEQYPQEKMQQALAAAYSLENNVVHPIAKAIVSYAQARNIQPIPLRDFKSVPGYGLNAFMRFAHRDVEASIGQLDFIMEKIAPEKAQALNNAAMAIKARGELLAVLLMDDDIFIFCFQDTLRPNIGAALDELRKNNRFKLLMLTGDHENNAKRVAADLHIDEYRANLRPEDKLDIVSKISQKRHLAMVGDGINDAPALARATVGICMGKVSNAAAMDAADIVLLHDNIEYAGWLMDKACHTQTIVKQNLTLAIFAIIMASIPALLGWIPLWLAVVMHEGGTVIVGLNGLRLLKK